MPHIVCATDFSPHADHALEKAIDLAKAQGARLTLLHVVVPRIPLLPGEKPKDSAGLSDHDLAERLREYMRGCYADKLEGIDWHISLRRGHPSEEVLDFLREKKADLAVVSGQGLSGMGPSALRLGGRAGDPPRPLLGAGGALGHGTRPRPVAVIAELGSVHDGSLGNAMNLIQTAHDCGADLVARCRASPGNVRVLMVRWSRPHWLRKPRTQPH